MNDSEAFDVLRSIIDFWRMWHPCEVRDKLDLHNDKYGYPSFRCKHTEMVDAMKEYFLKWAKERKQNDA